MFGRTKTKLMVVADIGEVAQKVFFTQNHRPVFGIEIQGGKGKFRFGSGLKDQEKAWLTAELKEAVFGKPEAARGPAPSRPAGVKKGYFPISAPAPGAGSLAVARMALMKESGLFRLIWLAVSAAFAVGGVSFFAALWAMEDRGDGRDRVTAVRVGWWLDGEQPDALAEELRQDLFGE